MKHPLVLSLMSLISFSPLAEAAQPSFEHCRGVVRLSKSMSDELSRDELEMISRAFAKKRFVLRLAKEKNDLSGLSKLHEFQLLLGNEDLSDGYGTGGYGSGGYGSGGYGSTAGYGSGGYGGGYGTGPYQGSGGYAGYGSGYGSAAGPEPVLSLVWNVPTSGYGGQTAMTFQTTESRQLTHLGWWFAQVVDRYVPNCEDVVSGKTAYEVRTGTTSTDRNF